MPPVELPSKTPQIFGRGDLLEQLEAILAGDAAGSLLLLLIGAGGTGKTRLLEALLERLMPRQRLHLPIYDFYHIDRFRAGAIEETIIQLFAAQRPDAAQQFAPYREAQRRLDTARQSGQAFEDAQSAVRQAFVASYNAYVAAEQAGPVVLLFDSVEQAVGLDDGAERRLQQATPTASSGGEHWLRQMLPQLQRTIVILSGRPHTLYDQPVALYGQLSRLMPTRHIPIAGMERPATDAFVHALRDRLCALPQPEVRGLAEVIDLDEPTRRLWYLISDGLPFWSAMLFTCAMFGVIPPEIDAVQERIMAGATPTLTEAERQRLREAAMRQFLSQLDANDQPLLLTLQWMATIRKGASAAMISAIATAEGVDIGDPAALVERVGQLLIVKSRRVPRYTFDGTAGEETLLFLHDELYHWLDRNLAGAVQLRPAVSAALIAWYNRAIDEAEAARLAAIDRSQTVGPHHPEADTLSATQRDHARRRDMLVLDRLGYSYQADREQGIAEYNMQAYAAIIRRAAGYRVMLRQEALRSHYRLDGQVPFTVEVECAARWILRATYFEDPDALSLLDRLEHYWEREATTPGLAYALLHLAVAQLLLFRRPENQERIRHELDIAQKILDRIEIIANPTSNQWRKLLLFRLKNFYGYWHRLQYQLFDAVESYEQSLLYSSEQHPVFAQLRSETLNNLAFALSEQGNVTEARRLALEGLELRRRFASDYNIALSLNTLARIEIRAGQIMLACEYAEQALAIFQRYQSPRGQSLCLPVLAETYRKLAEQLTYMVSRQEQTFEMSLRRFAEARDLLEREQIANAERWREVLHGIGCTYRSYAQTLHNRGVEPERAREYFQRAHQLMEEAVALAIEKHQPALIIMDIHEDLATVHVNQDEYDERVAIHLQRAEALAPAVYRFEPGIGLRGTRRPVYGFYRELAQCELQRMMLGFGSYDFGLYTRDRASGVRSLIRRGDPRDLQEAGRHLLLTLAYVLEYAHSSTMLDRATFLILRELRARRSREEIKLIATAIYQASRDYKLMESEARRLAERLIDQAFKDLGDEPIPEI